MLLLFDEHMTHIFYPCNSEGITRYIHLLKFPQHVIDILLPLDKCCLGPLKRKWEDKSNARIVWSHKKGW